MHENDNIVMIFKVVGNDITNNYFSISKKRYRSLIPCSLPHVTVLIVEIHLILFTNPGYKLIPSFDKLP